MVVFDPQNGVMEVHQVGKTQSSAGMPVSRELEAIEDIQMAIKTDQIEKQLGCDKVVIIYHPYDL